MLVHNSDVAEIFNKVADLLEILDENPFRVRAYRNAARTVGSLSQSVAAMVEQAKDFTELPGIGKDLAGKIEEIVRTGNLSQLQDLEDRIPPQLIRLMKIPGLGPKRVKTLYDRLNITSLEDLKKSAEAGEIKNLKGFGEKTEKAILAELGREKKEERIKLNVAEEVANGVVNYLKRVEGVSEVIVAGSFRRKKETVADLDILATCKKGSKVMDAFVEYGNVGKVVAKGETRATIVLRSGIQMDLRVVPEASYGAALHYFTGSKAHNIAVRTLGVKGGLKINEYGVFKGKKRIAGKREEEVFDHVGLSFIEPELREDQGEIEAAQQGKLPKLITLKDIRGDLHAHTKETDGRHTLEQMVEAARNRGYQYVAITDHSKRLSMTHGFDAKRLAKRNEEIDRLNGKLKGFSVLKSIEVDILEDGSLDLPDSILKELDLTVCSVHSKFNLPMKKQMERIIRAMDNPYFNVFAHPSGRLINERPPYDVDMEELIKAAKERGCAMEVNAHPDRLDLADIHCRLARDTGVKLVISTDAHSVNDYDLMRFGVWQARRGWVEKEDVLNTRSADELKKLLKRK
ncbi:MAG: DNA polymerase III [Deltaproteobacteria bacterium RBG_16_49_23]|nr:MAG: DNA polymerase III [Deltaproteobacteria bacterium RBG_16_49_23]